jgi:hypothetical protein
MNINPPHTLLDVFGVVPTSKNSLPIVIILIASPIITLTLFKLTLHPNLKSR